MKEATFEKKIGDILDEFERFSVLAGSTHVKSIHPKKSYHKKKTRQKQNMSESLDFLRLSIKYLLFDLDATRRENASLMRLLEDR